jgi:hypothetical protein
VHVSETAWVGTEFDAVVDNNGSIEDLYNQVKNLVLDRPDARATSACEEFVGS